MNSLSRWIKEHALVAFFILAYGFTWALFPLVSISPLMGILGLFGPAFAALVVTGVRDGREGVRRLVARLGLFRVGPAWYLVTLGLPVLLSAIIVGLSLLLGYPGPVRFQEINVLNLLVFVLVFGEELGWRGFALPELLNNRSGVSASLILGVLWSFWHLPTFFTPGMPQAGVPLLPYTLTLIGLTTLFTWLFQNTRGSLLIATLFHGAYNTFGLVNPSLDPASRWWLYALVYLGAGLVVFLAAGPDLNRRLAIRRKKFA